MREFVRMFGVAFNAALVDRMLRDVLCWLEEVRQDVCNVQSDIVALQREAEGARRDLDQLRAEFAHMKQKQRFQELVVQESRLVFSDAGMERRRLAQLKRATHFLICP